MIVLDSSILVGIIKLEEDCERLVDLLAARMRDRRSDASGPILKFASFVRHPRLQTSESRTTSNFMILVRF
jgi:hypothetical protein